MLVYRIIPFIIIGWGFLICRKIFRNYPLNLNFLKEQAKPAQTLAFWILALLIIFIQIIYIWNIFAPLADLESLMLPFFILISLFLAFWLWAALNRS